MEHMKPRAAAAAAAGVAAACWVRLDAVVEHAACVRPAGSRWPSCCCTRPYPTRRRSLLWWQCYRWPSSAGSVRDPPRLGVRVIPAASSWPVAPTRPKKTFELNILKPNGKREAESNRVRSSLKPRIVGDVVQIGSFARITLEHATDESSTSFWHVRRHRVLTVHNHRQRFTVIGLLLIVDRQRDESIQIFKNE